MPRSRPTRRPRLVTRAQTCPLPFQRSLETPRKDRYSARIHTSFGTNLEEDPHLSAKSQAWRGLAQQLRVDSIRCTTQIGSGHPTSSMSAADLMAVLFAEHLRYDFDDPGNPNNDHLLFSKGHAAPLLYSLFKAAGAITDDELLTVRHFGSRLQGHPTPAIPWVDVATGSLGHGLPIAVGIALAGKYIDKLPYRTWVLLGDSETAEGSVWEAISLAGHYHLDNLTGIIDVNRLGQRGPTALGWDTRTYAERIGAFGWHTIEIDGHDPDAIDRAYSEAEQQDRPTMIIAKTLKGKGFSELENRDGSHGKALSEDQAERAIAELGGRRSIVAPPAKPATDGTHSAPRCLPLELPRYDVGDQVPTRQGYGDALKALGAACSQVVAVDAEVNNSTYSDAFANEFPDRFFEMYIAEQQMVGAAIGLSVRGYVPFASSFAAFLTRAYDFIRMAAVSRANIKLCGSHSGVSIGEDGPSQMGLEDLSMMRAVSGSVVLYPSDANQAARLVAEMADHHGISYLRTTREKTPVIYSPDETFPIGGSRVVRSSSGDQATVVAAGVTLHEALTAHAQLAAEGIPIRVIDAYSVKPIDAGTLRQAAADTAGRIVVAEDHWPEGGLGDAVLSAFAGGPEPLPRAIKLAVYDLPGSGKPAEMIDAAGIGSRSIVDAVKRLL